MQKRWYVLSFTSNKFRSVEAFLRLKDVNYFCPMQEKEYHRPDKIHSIRKSYIPAFPGYLFIHIDFDKVHPEKLASFQYIYGLITFGDQPLMVSDMLVDEIKDACLVNKTEGSLKKSISSDFAAILLNQDPGERSVMLLNYLNKHCLQSLKEVKHAS